MVHFKMIEHASETLAPVSIVLNIWNGDNHVSLQRSLNSISQQKMKPDEVIAVIDGAISSDLEAVVSQFVKQDDFRVQLIRLPTAKGLWNGRNQGIAASRNEFIALHDADDVMHPERLSVQIRKMLANDIDVLGSPVFEFETISGEIIGLRKFDTDKEILKKMLWQNVINNSSVMLRKSAVDSVGGLRNVYLAEDYDLYLRLLRAGKNISITNEILQAFSVDGKTSKRRGGVQFFSSQLPPHQTVKSFNYFGFLRLYLRLFLRLVFRFSPNFVRDFHRKFFQLKTANKQIKNLDDFLNSTPESIT
jgi:glycosyltransferase involved in cell wall biosynthesis